MKTPPWDYLHTPVRGFFRQPNGQTGPACTVVTWNIARGTKLDEIIEALQGPLKADVYALQEVDRFTRRTGFRNLPEEIARQLGLDYVFGTEFEELAQRGGADVPLHGQMILSRLPIRRVRIVRFQHQPRNWGPWWKPCLAVLQPRRGGRMTLVAELEWDQTNLVLYDTHLESQTSEPSRARQMGEILSDIEPQYPPNTPIIIAGDFNTKCGRLSGVIQQLQTAQFQDVLAASPEPLYTAPHSQQRLDWIFLRGLRMHAACIHPLAISDHFPITAEISMAGTAKLKTGNTPANQGFQAEGKNHAN